MFRWHLWQEKKNPKDLFHRRMKCSILFLWNSPQVKLSRSLNTQRIRWKYLGIKLIIWRSIKKKKSILCGASMWFSSPLLPPTLSLRIVHWEKLKFWISSKVWKTKQGMEGSIRLSTNPRSIKYLFALHWGQKWTGLLTEMRIFTNLNGALQPADEASGSSQKDFHEGVMNKNL